MEVGQVVEQCQSLADGIWAAAASVKTYESACKTLARFSFRIVAVLKLHLGFVHLWDHGTKAAVARLQAFLRMGLQLVEDCHRTKHMMNLLCSDTTVEKFKAWAEAMHGALGELKTWGREEEVGDDQVRQELRKDIQNLQAQISGDVFFHGESEWREGFSEQLVAALDAGLEAPSMKAISDLMETVVTRAGRQIQALDIADLQKALRNPETLAGSPFTKDHVYVMLLSILRHGTQATSLDGIVDVPSCFRCPISMDLMREPVMLIETGQVYDRAMIEAWFEGGHDTCPVTQKRVYHRRLKTVHSLKSDIHEFATRYSVTLDKQVW
ncbi:unnamed protein product [Ostreobium quekettii]|uniref:U-box domain-containing protein n=1 Tax=Ostreobium quekettii TaxID=121088 RepID=A0A8S1ITE2_9CHLO|nr:unnamed protein product [Ostreobium quekettii]